MKIINASTVRVIEYEDGSKVYDDKSEEFDTQFKSYKIGGSTYENYINSKYSESTKFYIKSIVEYLKSNGETRAQNLQNAITPSLIPYLGTYGRLIKELTTLGILVRTEKPRDPGKRGKAAVYYNISSEEM